MGRVLVIGDGPVQTALLDNSLLRDHEQLRASGDIDALRAVRTRAIDVVVTDTESTFAEDAALVEELGRARPGIRVIVLARSATPDDLVAALKAHVFACFTPPFDPNEIADMVRSALNAPGWRDGIEVLSGLPQWFTLRASCHLLTADRLVRFITEYQTMMGVEQDLLITAFREMLLNAMEHGAGFDSEKVIEVTAARTARAIVYYFRDPGGGFDRRELAHTTSSNEPNDVLGTALRRAELGMRPGGFGMLIAREVADELVYNERGNEAILIKHLD
jgi:CheY-like chemotaxis protein/anti-sigma regulatory factor (Ser/Thr protein kinase)